MCVCEQRDRERAEGRGGSAMRREAVDGVEEGQGERLRCEDERRG